MSGPPDTIFGKIARKEIPSNIVYEDDLCLAFHDIAPQAPTHIVLIPKSGHIDRLNVATSNDKALLGHLMVTVGEVARKVGLVEDGYRIVINDGANAGQTVFHLHIHILGGRELKWPPG